jgi:hypothetical protein
MSHFQRFLIIFLTTCYFSNPATFGYAQSVTAPQSGLERPAESLISDLNKHSRLRPYLSGATEFVVWIDLQEITADELAFLQTINPGEPDGDMLNEMLAILRKHSVKRVYLVGGTLGLLSQQQLPLGIVVGGDTIALAKELGDHIQFSNLATLADEQALLIGANEMSIRIAKQARGEPHADLLASLAECQGVHGLAIMLTPHVREFFEFAPESGKIPRLAKGLTCVALYQERTSRLLAGFLLFKTTEQSQKFANGLNQEISDVLESADGSATKLLVSQDNRVTFDEAGQREFFPKLIEKIKQESVKNSTMNHLRQIVLALHNFYDAFGRFPPQSLANADGERLLSWRVLILPFLEENKLYEQFRLDEPWDSEHNLKLLDKMPKVYSSANPEVAADQLRRGVTCFVAPLTGNSIMGRPGPPVRFADILDGTSNTLLLLECNPRQAVPWTKPEDLTIESAAPLMKIIRNDQDFIVIATADGAVYKLRANIDPETFKALLSMNGGEIINFDHALHTNNREQPQR